MILSRPCDRGSVLLLMPAAMMVVIVLAAITVDLSLVRARHEQLESVAAAAANDAANQLSIDRLRVGSEGDTLAIGLDPQRVREIVEVTVAAHEFTGAWVVDAEVQNDQVIVSLAVDVRHIFGQALPGTPETRRITAVARARLVVRE